MNRSLRDRMLEEGFHYVSIDLFSGPGGLCTGFKWAGILPLIAVEWTDTTVETYSTSHNADVLHLSYYLDENGIHDDYLQQFLVESTKTLLIHGDINLVDCQMVETLLLARYGINSIDETVDVVSGGAPCESFSIAGTRTDNDERDDLFSNILRIARTVRSKMILFENVKGLFSKARDGIPGAIFDYICDSFEDQNALVPYRLVSRNPNEIVMKACDFGVPQARERLFLVGIRGDLDNINFEYPVPQFGPGTERPYVNVADAISDLPVVNMGEECTEYRLPDEFIDENQRWFISIMRGLDIDDDINSNVPEHLIRNGLFNDHSISVHKGPGHTARKQELLRLIGVGESMRSAYDRLENEGTLEEYRHLFPNTIYGSRNRRLLYGEPSFTVTSHCLDEILHPTLNRAITPREAARLQSFPDWYQFAGPYVQFHGSKEQDKYEQIGDAIPPLLAFAMATQIVEALENG